ncbi:MAG: GvpL/GvpF family gas vesicle protein [Acidobacteria bacterium]|nr:GvpL/GvpF family gas vesicle protein [Acidobacteriota bacterium]
MKLYAYCVVEAGLDVLVAAGAGGEPPTMIRHGDLAVLAGPARTSVEALTREDALRHAAVVNSILEVSSPIPFRFGTVADVEHLKSFLSENHQELNSLLGKVRNCVQMELKVCSSCFFSRADAETPASTVTSGTAFLHERKRRFDAEKQARAQFNEAVALLERSLETILLDRVEESAPPFLACTAHLIGRASRQSYLERVDEWRGSCSLKVVCSGPWAPASFVQLSLKQFGNSSYNGDQR